ncbi:MULTISPECIES: hypothetical protein [Leptolyngbya]|uniref:hypothetical protein n=1 Tax=Leptolyngbya TaxID=47251 RepID=UPI001681F1D0|nr:hypothetical protein [Leptolyngbya sp. FACHB-1624]MBD1857723.1 hypothetical protein [Leptolyngbya sp. FACHB-1624]
MTPDSEKLLAEMYLTQQRLLVEVTALRAQLEGHPAIADGWMSGADAAISLKPEGIKSARHLQKLRLDGAFSESKGEIRNMSAGERPTWQYHVPTCRKALQRHFRQIRAV